MTIQRNTKRKNKEAKARQREKNIQLRADTNRARANDKTKPAWAGIPNTTYKVKTKKG